MYEKVFLENVENVENVENEEPDPNNMFPCCMYADPDHSYLEPIHELGLNPSAGRISCEGTDLGEKLFGSYNMDSMYDCIFFGPYT